jgi:hypothetical protein
MYLPLFDIEVKHQFFTSGMHRTFTVSPTVRTEALAAQLGVSSRQTPDGIRVFYESRRLQELQGDIDHPETALPLGFKLDTVDHLFARYTEPMCPGGSVFYFDQRCAQVESAERSRLHRDAQVSGHEVEALESPPVDALLEATERAAPPLGVIRVSLAPSDGPRTYSIRFAARQTFWTYYLLGSFARDGLYMEDAKGDIDFDSLGEVTLPDHRVARAFRTTSMLPLQDRYHNRFQIIDPDAVGDRVLMARMPGAQVRQTYPERLNGMDVAVSEIFINGF